MQSPRERAIAEYHARLVADETLTPAMFEKLRRAMRKNQLLYGERPIGVALRPHLLHHKQFQKLNQAAQRVTSALEKIATAVVEDPKLMEELGLTEAERRMALVDPGFSTAGVTTRLASQTNTFAIGYDTVTITFLCSHSPIRVLFALRPKLECKTKANHVERRVDAQLVSSGIIIENRSSANDGRIV